MNNTHQSTAIASIAGALASLIIYIAEKKFGFDLSGQESNITVIVMGVAVFAVQQLKGNDDETPTSKS